MLYADAVLQTNSTTDKKITSLQNLETIISVSALICFWTCHMISYPPTETPQNEHFFSQNR